MKKLLLTAACLLAAVSFKSLCAHDTATVDSPVVSQKPTVSNPFVIGPDGLSFVRLGMSERSIRKAVKGCYDGYRYLDPRDEMGMLAECGYEFYRGGKKVAEAYADGGKFFWITVFAPGAVSADGKYKVGESVLSLMKQEQLFYPGFWGPGGENILKAKNSKYLLILPPDRDNPLNDDEVGDLFEKKCETPFKESMIMPGTVVHGISVASYAPVPDPIGGDVE